MGQQTSQKSSKACKRSAFRAETALHSDTCFVVLKVDARKGGGASARGTERWPRPTRAGKVEVMDTSDMGAPFFQDSGKIWPWNTRIDEQNLKFYSKDNTVVPDKT